MKKPFDKPNLSDSSLLRLWRRTVLKLWGYSCIICGQGGNLDCHHIIKRRYKLLLFDWRNGVPVHEGECHERANLEAPRMLSEEQLQYLQGMRALTKKAYLFAERLSESEWRQRVKEELEKKLLEPAELLQKAAVWN